MSAFPTAAPSTNGASAWRRAPATRSAPRCRAAAAPTARPSSTRSTKWDEWLRKYAPPGAADLDFYQSLPALSQGNVAQQIFWYTAFTAEHGGAEGQGQQHRRRPGQSAVADGAVAAWPLLEGRLEARLSGRRLVDAVQLDPARPPQGSLALCPVRRLEDRRRQEEPCRSDLHPRQHRASQVLHRTRAQAWRSDRVLPLARPRRVDARPASTSPTIRSSPSCCGRISATSIPAPSRRSRQWTAWPARWIRSWPACRRWTRRSNVYDGCGPRLNPESDPSKWLGKRSRALGQARQREAQGRDHRL